MRPEAVSEWRVGRIADARVLARAGIELAGIAHERIDRGLHFAPKQGTQRVERARDSPLLM
jgi:hypothetical protein